MRIAEDVKLSAHWEATQSYPFCVFLFSFFIIKTLLMNYIMKCTCPRNPVNKHQKAQMSFFSTLFFLTTFCYLFHAMINILTIFLHEHNNFIEDNEEFNLGART